MAMNGCSQHPRRGPPGQMTQYASRGSASTRQPASQPAIDKMAIGNQRPAIGTGAKRISIQCPAIRRRPAGSSGISLWWLEIQIGIKPPNILSTRSCSYTQARATDFYLPCLPILPPLYEPRPRSRRHGPARPQPSPCLPSKQKPRSHVDDERDHHGG